MVRARDLRVGDVMCSIIHPENRWVVSSVTDSAVWLEPCPDNSFHPASYKEDCSITAEWSEWNLCEITNVKRTLERYE